MTATSDLLRPVPTDDDHPPALAGTLDHMAGVLAGELALSGYSLTVPEVLASVIKAVRAYAAHATLEAQRRQSAGTTEVPINGSLALDLYEWSMVQPLARAYCDLVQAYRMEAAASVGMERYGLQVGEVVQTIEQLEANLPKSAFVEPPFSIGLE